MSDLGQALFTTPEMAALFSGRALVERMLVFEAALARAQARAGVIPPSAAEAIAARCRIELIDLPTVLREAAASATPAVPLVRMLTAQVGGEAKRYVHWGATSQDAIDTAEMLQVRDGLDLLADRLLDAAGACAALAEEHRRTPMAGRTLLQQAVPITFGLKTARWLSLFTRRVSRLRAVREEAPAVQLGGAAGTLASLGTQGVRVMEYLAEDLGLAVPDLPWHAERDRIGEIAAALAIVAASMSKVAIDLALLAQTEVGEVSTSSAGHSSAMPHKRNPVEAIQALAAARLASGTASTLLAASGQEHERAAGGWQAEWQALPDLFRFTAGAVEWTARALANLEVHADQMRLNLERTSGLVMAESLTMALAEHLGRTDAYRIVEEVAERAARSGIHLREAANADERIRAVLSPDRLEHVLDPAGYLGSADVFIDRALAAFRRLRGGEGRLG